MSGRLDTVHRILTEAVDELRAVAGSGASDDELLSVLTLCEGLSRRVDRVAVDTVAAVSRRGVLAERGYRNTAGALCDLVGWERFEARRRVVAAEQVCSRVGLDGAVLPARLPSTAERFAAGAAGLRHVEVIASVLGSGPAGRLDPPVWAAAEAQLAGRLPSTPRPSSPSGVRRWSRRWTPTAPNPTTGRPRRSTNYGCTGAATAAGP